MQNPARLHFISGKGGVGKSTFAAALAYHLSEAGEGPVLLIEMQGSGRALKLLGLEKLPYENTSLPRTKNTWGARILPRETFKQYFGVLLALGDENSMFAQVTSGLRHKVVDLILDNKVVSAFVDACPGLEPSVLLGKVQWEATEGKTPESYKPWRHVVVDAPATGHGVMLFKSTFALMEVFGAGAIFKQATKIKSYVQNPELCHSYLVSTPEELPLQELKEMHKSLGDLGIKTHAFVINRSPPTSLPISLTSDVSTLSSVNETEWAQEIAYQIEAWRDQEQLIADMKKITPAPHALIRLPEVSQPNEFESLKLLSTHITEALKK